MRALLARAVPGIPSTAEPVACSVLGQEERGEGAARTGLWIREKERGGGKAEDSQADTEVPDGEPVFVRGIARGLGAARWHVGTKHSHACR